MTQRTPFKFLDAYTQADRDIFCGRDADIEELHARALQNRLLLVYGPSGVGKTSLIQCGLMNKFPAADRLPLTIRYDGNIFAALDRAIAALTTTPILADTSLTEKLQALYFEYFTPITLIFDQLEELFIFGATDERDRFAAEIAALLDAPFKLRILFVIREEYLAELTAFETQLPDLFANRLRVERMSHANVRRAIEEPCKECDIGIEKGLAEQIIARLGASKNGAIELTYLQVVLDKLYAKALEYCAQERHGAESAVALTMEDFETLGDIGDILGAFLNEQLAMLSREKAALGEAILKALITPDGTKKAMTVQEIISDLHMSGQASKATKITELLNHFVSVRILSEKEDSSRYEFRHDSLAAKMFERMTALEKGFLEVKQLLEHRCDEYRKRGTLLDADTLQFVTPYENRLRMKADFAKLILSSKRKLKIAQRKRQAIIIAAVSAAFIIVSVLGGFSYLKYREAKYQATHAEAQRQLAEQQREYALKANATLTTVMSELNSLSGSNSDVNVKRIIKQMEQMYALDRNNYQAQPEQASNLSRIGDLWMAIKDTQAALTAYRQSSMIFKRLLHDDPTNITLQNALAVVDKKINHLQLDDTPSAITYPEDLEATVSSYITIGQTQEELKRIDAALQWYQQALPLAERLAAQAPANTKAQKDLKLVQDAIKRLQALK